MLNINIDKTNSFVWVFIISDKLLTGKKPPEEIIVIARFNELKALTLNKFRIINIDNVIRLYSIKILNDCFKISALLKDIKFVKDFLKLMSKISINKIIENKKYRPPTH